MGMRWQGSSLRFGVGSSTFSFRAEVWEHDGAGRWHFVSLPPDVADDIEERFGSRAGGFGSVRVEASIGSTSWLTSLFPDSKRATYVLPVKRDVRAAEALSAGAVVRVDLVVQ